MSMKMMTIRLSIMCAIEGGLLSAMTDLIVTKRMILRAPIALPPLLVNIPKPDNSGRT